MITMNEDRVFGTATVLESNLITAADDPDRCLCHEGILQDRNGTYSFRQTQNLSKESVFPKGEIVKIEGTLDEDKVILVNSMETAAEDMVDWREYIPYAPLDYQKCLMLLERAISKLEDFDYWTPSERFLRGLKDKLEANHVPEISDPEASASVLRHMALELLILTCLRRYFVDCGMDWDSLIDLDLVIAGILVSDAGALGDIEPDHSGTLRLDSIGCRLRDHAETSGEYVHAISTYQMTDPGKNAVLTNAVLSHDRLMEDLPTTVEALLLTRINRLACILEACAHTLPNTPESEFTAPLPVRNGTQIFHHKKNEESQDHKEEV